MKPYDKVSSRRGANTLLQGQHNKHRRDITEQNRTEKTDHRRPINRQIKQQIQGGTNTDERRRDHKEIKE
jgi:hypothetical protein